jgi:hypothetical protein
MVTKIEGAANRIHSHLQPGEKVTRGRVNLLYTQGPAKLDSCVAGVTKEKVAAFKKKNGKAPDAAAKKKIVSSAWAICKASTGL